MKKLIALLVLAVGIASATERVNLTCKFDAVAAGYVNKLYSANLILEDNKFYNSDGSSGNNRNAIFANGTNTYKEFSFQLFDGNEYRGLYTDNRLKYNIPVTWTLNTGEVTCTMKRGWGNSYYRDNNAVEYVHDTVIKVEKMAPSWASCVSVMPHYRDTVYVHDTVIKVEKMAPSWASCVSVMPHYRDTVYVHDTVESVFEKPNFEPSVVIKKDTVIKVVRDTIIKVVKDSILDSSKATQRFSLRGKYVGLAANETDCEFYTHFLKYNDSVFNENGEYVDSFEIKLLYTSGSYYKTIKLERSTLLTIMGHPAIYPTRKGNYYITTERNWNEESVKDWSKVKPSSELQKQIDRLRSELGKQ